METVKLIEEVTQILQKQHPRYDNKGDRIANASHFLRSFRKEFPEISKSIAFDMECQSESLSAKTGLPERRIFQISRVLFGIWCEL